MASENEKRERRNFLRSMPTPHTIAVGANHHGQVVVGVRDSEAESVAWLSPEEAASFAADLLVLASLLCEPADVDRVRCIFRDRAHALTAPGGLVAAAAEFSKERPS